MKEARDASYRTKYLMVKRDEQREAAGSFLAFVLSHDGCGDEVIEARLDESLLECWCLRCNESRTFGLVG